MVTCPTCGVVLFVDMDGVAQAAGDPGAEASDAAFSDRPQSMPMITSPMQPEPMTSGPAEFGPEDPEPMQQAHSQPLGPEPLSAVDGGQELDMGGFLGYDSAPSDLSNEPSQNDPNDPLGISAYANSELSSAKNGPLVVTVIISGIDTKDLRGEIRQALQDSRFGWDASTVMASIKGGTLVLPRISPVKASIVINRIKNLAVQIRWEQNAITELEISPNDSLS